MSERPSVYLVDKCKAIGQALEFFASSYARNGVVERRLTFLAQIDFWDWEMAELIFSVESFTDRAQAWKANKGGMDQLLRSNKIVVKASKINEVGYARSWRYSGEVVAPIKQLNQVIEQWNKLLKLCEALLDTKVVQYGVEAVTNLNQYRKKPIEIKPVSEEHTA
jgi:hypothetical protein